jgi:hypothetical protein
MTLVQLIHLYLMGSPSEGVAALSLCNSAHVGHFDKEGINLSRMKRVMKVVEHYAKGRGVWKPLSTGSDYWNGETEGGMVFGRICCLCLLHGRVLMMAERILITRAGLAILVADAQG